MRLAFPLTVVAAAAVVLVCGIGLDPFKSFVLTRILIYMILAMGLNILMGYAGQLAFAHAALFGVGAYATGLLQVRLGLGFAASAVLGTAVTTLVGSALVLPALRLSGMHLAISTLAVAQAIQWTFVNWISVTYGPGGFRAPPLDIGFGLAKHQSIFVVSVVVVAVIAILVDNLLRGSFGRRFVAVRDNPIAASAMGVNVTAAKTIAFATSAALAGIAGALFSALLGFVSPESFNLDQMVMMQVMVVIGGLGSLIGSLIGPVAVVLLMELLRDAPGLLEIVFGIMLIGFVLMQPDGLAALVNRALGWRECFLPRALGREPRGER
jgi:branched-chain amino acid transport system permease protein